MSITMKEHTHRERDIHPQRQDSREWSDPANGLDSLGAYRIIRIELFRYDSELAAKRQLGDQSQLCGLMAITTTLGVVGLREFAIPCSSLRGDFTMWASQFQRLKGLNLPDSLDYVQRRYEALGPERSEFMESALLDAAGKTKLTFITGKDRSDFMERAYLLAHTQAYVRF
ncbi:hypothetical protein [Bacillus sp. 3255]|uniref:hypothetical protein n=1 Tax=Bacillus sp. 3255 TaxID=2817904 RepID=UPI00285D23DC|nr:hypothetical protein [Bacillus sp. 3255]MDR6880538.1 hypothetical protein [Bacillus sp. 3255]